MKNKIQSLSVLKRMMRSSQKSINTSNKIKSDVKINMSENDKMNEIKLIINNAVDYLRSNKRSPKILIEIYGNLGDSTNATAIIKHYKLKYPDCCAVFLTKNYYLNAHELNKDFDKVYGLPNGLNPQERIKIGEHIMNNYKDIDFKLCPSIFPYSAVWKSHVWSFPVISHQFFHNAKINVSEMLGDKKIIIPVSNDDIEYATNFVGNRKCIALEFNSYSHEPFWNCDKFTEFTKLMKNYGFNLISFAGPNEGIISGTIDARGMTWRRTVAILSKCKYVVGIGSGITMLAAAARPTPTIIEMGVSDSISMKSCGYADSHVLKCDPINVCEYIMNAENNERKS